MTYLGSSDFLIEVAKGNVAKHSLVHKFGRNDAVPNASFEFVNLLGWGPLSWPLSAATTVRIKAGGDAADDAGGNGAREVTVQGIDTSFNEVSEAITTNGIGVSTSTNTSFWRIHRAWVSSAGTYNASNTAAVTIENTAGSEDLIMIGVEEGQTQFAGWTVPIGKTAYLLSAHLSADSAKAADFRMFTRANMDDAVAPVSPNRLKLYFDGVLGQMSFTPRSPGGAIAAKSDIWWEAQGGGAGTEVAVDFELLVVDD